MWLEATCRDRIKVQRLLINFDLILEADFCDWNKRFACITDLLDFNPDHGVTCDSVSEPLLACRAVLPPRAALVPRRNKTNPDIALAVVDPVRHVRVIAVVEVSELMKAVHSAANHKLHSHHPHSIAAPRD